MGFFDGILGGGGGSKSSASTTVAPVAQGQSGVNDASANRGNQVQWNNVNVGKSAKINVTVQGLSAEQMAAMNQPFFSAIEQVNDDLADIAKKQSGIDPGLDAIIDWLTSPMVMIAAVGLAVLVFWPKLRKAV